MSYTSQPSFIWTSKQTLWMANPNDPTQRIGLTLRKIRDGTQYLTVEIEGTPWLDEEGKIIPRLERVPARTGMVIPLSDVMQMIALLQQDFSPEQLEEFNRARVAPQEE